MEKKGAQRFRVLELLEHHGGLRPGVVQQVSRETGVPAADVYGVATFYTLVARPDANVRVCQGLSCKLGGADELLAKLTTDGVAHEAVSCLGACDRPPVAIDAGLELATVGPPGGLTPDDPELPMNLAGAEDPTWPAFAKARGMGAAEVLDQVDQSGLQGRGGAGFPAAFKWKAVARHASDTRYLVMNADEGEPGTFKDRALMLHRPHLVMEGLAIAALAAGADTAFIYVRGEFPDARRALERALTETTAELDWLDVRFVMGHGAYICGEETALLEAIEGRRGMPRLKPPYPTDKGLWGQPTLMNNVETLACVPSIVVRGAQWFRDQGRAEPGSKLYCVSGHVQRPGTYELPLGATLDEVVKAAGGYVGTPKAFSPGGASAGFLSMEHRSVPLDFGSLGKVGSMLGSAGLVVINDTVPMPDAVRWQQVFFEDESCGQCTPCRVGARMQRQAIDAFLAGDGKALQHVEDVHWEMDAGSICGLGMTASLPLQSAMKHFPEEFGG